MSNYFEGPVGELRLKVLEALRSGEYPQGKYKLGNKKEGFCCLGVACTVLGIPFLSNDTYSDSLKNAIKLKYATGVFMDEEGNVTQTAEGITSLTEANDHKNLSFSEIANLIERIPRLIFEEA